MTMPDLQDKLKTLIQPKCGVSQILLKKEITEKPPMK